MTDYLDYELLDVRPARIFDASETVENFADILESKAGSFGVSWTSESHPWQRKFNWFCADRNDIAAARSFLGRRQGKYKPFWVPTWTADFLLLADSAVDAFEFVVHDSGMDAIRGFVAVITVNGVYPRAITGYTDNLDGTRTLKLNMGIPEALSIDTTLISYLSFVRLVDDEAVMDFVGLNSAELELDYVEVDEGEIPRAIPDGDTTSFLLWLQADKPFWPSASIPADGARLEQQNDTSGNGNHGIPALPIQRPRYDLNIQNGLPGVFFDADPHFPEYSPWDGVERLYFPDDALRDLPEGEAFFVLKLTADPSPYGRGLWQMHADPDSLGSNLYRGFDNHVHVAFGSPPIDLGIVPLDLSKAHILNAVASATEKTFRFNSVVRHTETGAFAPQFPRQDAFEQFATLAARADGFGGILGWSLEFVFVSPVRTPLQRAAWHRYFGSKWAVELTMPPPISVLAVGGGGAGGWVPATNSYSGGGGGAGGYVEKAVHLLAPGSYPVVIGAGGAGGFEPTNESGGDTTFDTIVAKGGGRGACQTGLDNVAGASGGSGGGGQRNGAGGGVLPGNTGGFLVPVVGTGNGGGGGSVFSSCGGGGGGALTWGAGAEILGGASLGRPGGNGRASTISGASVTYAGGGGSGGYDTGPLGTGGAGGGGSGGVGRNEGGNPNGANATGIGCGGGGAGSSNGGVACSGGSGTSGIVVIRYKTSDFGACTGGTITTDGAYTVHTFTSNGTFTLVAA